MSFRGVTAATGWIKDLIAREVAKMPPEFAISRAMVLHTDQNEVRIALPSGQIIVLAVRVEEGEAYE